MWENVISSSSGTVPGKALCTCTCPSTYLPDPVYLRRHPSSNPPTSTYASSATLALSLFHFDNNRGPTFTRLQIDAQQKHRARLPSANWTQNRDSPTSPTQFVGRAFLLPSSFHNTSIPTPDRQISVPSVLSRTMPAATVLTKPRRSSDGYSIERAATDPASSSTETVRPTVYRLDNFSDESLCTSYKKVSCFASGTGTSIAVRNAMKTAMPLMDCNDFDSLPPAIKRKVSFSSHVLSFLREGNSSGQHHMLPNCACPHILTMCAAVLLVPRKTTIRATINFACRKAYHPTSAEPERQWKTYDLKDKRDKRQSIYRQFSKPLGVSETASQRRGRFCSVSE
jgi:hypothetical protein